MTNLQGYMRIFFRQCFQAVFSESIQAGISTGAVFYTFLLILRQSPTVRFLKFKKISACQSAKAMTSWYCFCDQINLYPYMLLSLFYIGVDNFHYLNHLNITVHKHLGNRLVTVLVRTVLPVYFRHSDIFFLGNRSVKALVCIAVKAIPADLYLGYCYLTSKTQKR